MTHSTLLRLGALMIGCLLYNSIAYAGAPQGHWRSVPPEVQKGIVSFLMQEGLCLYPCDVFLHGQQNPTERRVGPKLIEGAMSTYLLDHRHLLSDKPLRRHKKVDVFICLMIKKGNTSLDSYKNNLGFMEFCSEHLQ